MKTVVETSPAAFLERAGDYLERTALENNVAVGIAYRAVARPDRYPGGFWSAIVEAPDVVAVAVQTPPWPLLVSPLPPGAAASLAGVLRGRAITEATGPDDAVRALALELGFRVDPTFADRQRLYAMRTPPARPAVHGALRVMNSADRDLALRWLPAFDRDVGLSRPADDVARALDLGIPDGLYYLWTDGDAVCMANRLETPPDGCRIGSVYTPPELRRRGYAGAIVAALTRHCFDRGAAWCCLYTQLDNPTSNSIYQKIGYRPVLDVVKLHLLG